MNVLSLQLKLRSLYQGVNVEKLLRCIARGNPPQSEAAIDLD